MHICMVVLVMPTTPFFPLIVAFHFHLGTCASSCLTASDLKLNEYYYRLEEYIHVSLRRNLFTILTYLIQYLGYSCPTNDTIHPFQEMMLV